MKTNKKVIFASLFILVIIIFGCINNKNKDVPNNLNEPQELSEKEINDFFTILDKDLKVGEFESLDVDNDGTDDKYVLTFDRRELADDLFLDKSVEYEKTEEGLMGTVILEFENTGDETKTYTHIEKIPKSFAKHVDDLEFSVPPTEIIDPDPELEWMMQVIKRSNEKIIIKAKKAAISAALKADPGNVLLVATGMSEPTKKMIEAGKDAVADVALDNLDGFVFIFALNDCSKFGGEGSLWNTCITNLIVKFPEKFVESDCDQIDVSYPDVMNYVKGSTLLGICKAITTEDWGACHDNTDTWKEVDLCKLTMFKALSGECEYIKDDEKKNDCIYNSALKSNSKYGCNYITDEITKKGCFAELTQEITYCEGMDDDDAIKYCCDKIVNEGERKKCFGEGEKGKSSMGEFNCPIPEGAKHIIKTNISADYWEKDGKKVGPWSIVYNERKLFNCFNIDGEQHGMQKSWYKDGTLYSERNYKDGKQDGVQKSWHEDGTLQDECNFKDGKQHGVQKEWDESGNLLRDCNYKDGEIHGRCMSWRGEGIYENGVEIEYESYLVDQSVEFKGFK